MEQQLLLCFSPNFKCHLNCFCHHFTLFIQQYWIQVPLIAPSKQCDPVIEGIDENMEDRSEDTWLW